MCYSAEVWQDYRQYQKSYGVDLDIREFVRLFYQRLGDKYIKIAKAMTMSFAGAQTPEESEIAALIVEFNEAATRGFEQELFKQTKRKNDALRILEAKTTKKAQEELRISTDKIDTARFNLEELRRIDAEPRDSRIFPAWYAPVMVVENGRWIVKPMRYQCRIPGMPASSDFTKDKKRSGTYNARRDNLTRYWRRQFGYTHGLVVAKKFYENVSRHDMEHRPLAPGEKEENVRLEFKPSNGQDMLVACLWAHWTDPSGKEPDLLSFAAITDEPPEEVAAAGHDRCIIPIKPENIDAWLNPDPSNLDALQAILDDRERPFYEHRQEREKLAA